MSAWRKVAAPRPGLESALEGVRGRPEEPRAWIDLACALESTHRFEDSLAALENALRLSRLDTTMARGETLEEDAMGRRATMAVALGKTRTETILQNEANLQATLRNLRLEAVACHLDRLLGQSPPDDRRSPQARLRAERLRGQAHQVLSSRPSEALGLALEALRMFPYDVDVYDFALRQSEILVDWGRTDEAERWLRALADATLDADVMLALVAIHRDPRTIKPSRERWLADLERLEALFPSRIETRRERAIYLFRDGMFDEAARLRDRLVSQPGRLTALLELDTLLRVHARSDANALERSGRELLQAMRADLPRAQAIKHYQEALDINPYDLRAVAPLVEWHMSRVEHTQAQKLALNTFRLLPDSLEATWILLNTSLETCETRRARSAALYLLGRWPHSEAWERLAEVCRIGEWPDWARAAEEMSAARQAVPAAGSGEVSDAIFRQAQETTAEQVLAEWEV